MSNKIIEMIEENKLYIGGTEIESIEIKFKDGTIYKNDGDGAEEITKEVLKTRMDLSVVPLVEAKFKNNKYVVSENCYNHYFNDYTIDAQVIMNDIFENAKIPNTELYDFSGLLCDGKLQNNNG
jgi:hypothetical protein